MPSVFSLLSCHEWYKREWEMWVVSMQCLPSAIHFFSRFSSAPAWVPHWSQLEPSRSSLGQSLAYSYRGHYCQHLRSVTRCAGRPLKYIWVCPAAGLWLLHHIAAHCSWACLWYPCPSGQTVFPGHGIAAWEKGSSSTLLMVKSHHTDG